MNNIVSTSLSFQLRIRFEKRKRKQKVIKLCQVITASKRSHSDTYRPNEHLYLFSF